MMKNTTEMMIVQGMACFFAAVALAVNLMATAAITWRLVQ